MKKLLLLLTLVLSVNAAFSQQNDSQMKEKKTKDPNQLIDGKNKNDYAYTIGDTLFMNDGNRFVVGENLKLGYGSNPRKDFQFINISPASWATIMAGPKIVSLGSGWANLEMTIKDFKLWGTKKQGKKWYIILGGGNIANYACEIREALDFGEVRTALNDSKKQNNTNNSDLSIADELKKLKELLDSGIITQEEFDAQKAKLLK